MTLDAPLLMLTTSASQMGQGQQTGLWVEEFAVPFLHFRQAGIPMVVASTRGGKVPLDPRSLPSDEQRQQWQEPLASLEETQSLETVRDMDYAGVFVPGGHGAMFDMPDNPLVAEVIERTWEQGGVIGALCHGPAALVGARNGLGAPLVLGHRLTCFSNEEEAEIALDDVVPFLLESRLEELGAELAQAENFHSHVIVDGRLVTGQNPASSDAIAEAMITALGSY